MTVQAALGQPHLSPQRLFEYFPFQAADIPIFLGQFLIRAIILPQNRQRAARRSVGSAFDLDVVTAAAKRVAQPFHAIFETAVGESPHARDERVADSLGDRVAGDRIGDFTDFTPQDQRQVAVVIPKLAQALFGDAINIVRSSAAAANQVAGDEVLILERSNR